MGAGSWTLDCVFEKSLTPLPPFRWLVGIFLDRLFDALRGQIENLAGRVGEFLERCFIRLRSWIFLCHRREYNSNPRTRTADRIDTGPLHSCKPNWTPPLATVRVRARGRR